MARPCKSAQLSGKRLSAPTDCHARRQLSHFRKGRLGLLARRVRRDRVSCRPPRLRTTGTSISDCAGYTGARPMASGAPWSANSKAPYPTGSAQFQSGQTASSSRKSMWRLLCVSNPEHAIDAFVVVLARSSSRSRLLRLSKAVRAAASSGVATSNESSLPPTPRGQTITAPASPFVSHVREAAPIPKSLVSL